MTRADFKKNFKSQIKENFLFSNNPFTYFLGHVIAATGTLYNDKDPTTEVIDLQNIGKPCKYLPDIKARRTATGGLIGNHPVICGGIGMKSFPGFQESSK